MKQKISQPLVWCIPWVLAFWVSSCSITKPTIEVTNASEEETTKAIIADQWIFIADHALPQRGRSRILTSRYAVILKSDTLKSDLPYFGQAYTAVIGETKSPLDFTSVNPGIDKKNNRKNKWTIEIKPNDYREVQSFNFTFYSNGAAQLNVALTNRSSISFNGKLMPIQ